MPSPGDALLKAAVLAAALALVTSTAALAADPCTAIPDGGPAPPYLNPGSILTGPVVLVLDGDSLCVARSSARDSWVEIRLVDFYAREADAPGGQAAKSALQRIALGKEVTCKMGPQSYDRVVAACQIAGRRLGDLMRAAGVPEGGRGYGAVAEVREAPAPLNAQRHAHAMAPMSASAAGAFPNCAAARAAGAAPLYRGDPGYGPHLDRDNDGVACEPYRRR